MSEAAQIGLQSDHQDRARRDSISEAFRAWRWLTEIRPFLDRQAGEPTGSLATCEKVPTSDPAKAENSPEAYRHVEHITDAREALQVAIDRDRHRQEQVIGLIGAGETAHAKRLANCRRSSVQLQCPQLAGGCGSDDNYVPIHCDSRLCPECMKRRQGRAIQRYKPAVREWENPTMIRLSLPDLVDRRDLELAVETIRDAFGRLRRRVIQPEGSHQGRRWVWRADGGQPADHYWKSGLTGAGEYETARRWQKRYVSQDRGIPADEIFRGGFYGIDIKETDSGEFNVHLHILADVPYLPQAALAAEWDDLTGAPVVDIRRIDAPGGDDLESAIAETIGYAAKPPEFETVEAEVEYLTTLKGSNLIQPFGDLHENTPLLPSGLLRCSECDTAPAYWNYVDTVGGCYDNMTVGTGPDGDRPPPDDPGGQPGEG